ncbi:GDP-L-fucose synthase family protein [Aeromicrobium sp.]|uniref:GDP-L-fucose synthase family protein n=1 Tax=Aeromicrobium sp. TaxID=1871063 RepID=UPI003D6BB588
MSVAPDDGVDFEPGPLNRSATFYVAGHRGTVGSAIMRRLATEGFTSVVGASSADLDLTDRDAVFAYFARTKPRYVALAAAKVGGILANTTCPVDFLTQNVQIQANVMDAAVEHRVERLVFVGSASIYPRLADPPISEDALMTGPLEPTNSAYAIAKLAGVMHVQAVRRQYELPWISAIPTNLYGPNDNFSPQGSHVLPALIRRYHKAAASGLDTVTNWGTGSPRREFLHVDDLAAAVLYMLEQYDGPQQLNVGTGTDVTIRELAETIAGIAGYDGATEWDTSKPDGTPQKLLDTSKLSKAGWAASISLEDGLRSTYAWYREHLDSLRE